MNWLKSMYPMVREIIKNSIPDWWPELNQVLNKLICEPSPPEAMFPLASCKAVGGEPKEAVSVSAALLTLGMSVRLFDDLVDRDKNGQLWETVGLERTWNYASTVQNISFAIISKSAIENSLKQRINQCLIDTFFAIAAGQDRDIAGMMQSEEEYWLTVELKSAYVYATACETGAMMGTENDAFINFCRVFGRHLGRTVQILNDMESIWCSKGESDLEQNKVTLPVHYGLAVNHPAKGELEDIINSGKIADKSERVIEILNSIDTKKFLYWAALKERELAIEALDCCPDPEGKEALESYITGMFGDIDILLSESEKKKEDRKGAGLERAARP